MRTRSRPRSLLLTRVPWQWATTLLASGWIAWTLLHTVSDAPPPAHNEPVRQPAAVAGTVPAGAAIDALAGWQPFGDRAAVPAEPMTTSLDVTLQGIIVTADGVSSQAILGIEGRQRRYGAGDVLPLDGPVRLVRAARDHVLLDNGGRSEVLWLYPPASAVTTGPPAVAVALPPVPVTAQTQALQLAEHRVGGELRGYRLQPGRDSERFARLGMEPGDLVKAFDSAHLDHPDAAQALFMALRDRRDLHLLIQRDSQELTLLIAGSAI